MKNQLTRRAVMWLVLAVPLALALLAQARSAPVASPRQAGGYDLSWWTVDGGGGSVAEESSGYALAGTAGQPDAAVLAGGGYTLRAGFWGGVERGPEGYVILLPLVLRSY